MKVSLIAFLLFSVVTLIISSCSHINQSSQEAYSLRHNFRHGIIVDNSAERATIIPASANSIKKGKSLYQANCYSCHGRDGDGNGPQSTKQNPRPRNLIKIVKEVPNFKFYLSVSQWVGKMPGWKSPLNEAEIKDIKNYLVHLSKQN